MELFGQCWECIHRGSYFEDRSVGIDGEWECTLDEDAVPEGAGVTCRCPRFVEDTELKQMILEEEAFERAYGEEYMQMRLAALRREHDATH